MVYHMYNFLIYPSLCDTIILASRLYSSPSHRFCQFLQGYFSASCHKLSGLHTRIYHSLITPFLGPFHVHFAFCLFVCFILSNCDYNESKGFFGELFHQNIDLVFLFKKKQNKIKPCPIFCMLFATIGYSFPQDNVLF